MKKSVIAVVAGAMSAMSLVAGSESDVILAFSTPGPDTYADGRTVCNGEYYAVVWTQTNSSFAGIGADGKAIGDESVVVLKAALAQDGKCPSIVFRLPGDYEVDGKTIAELKDSGTWSVYLLDTRTYDTDDAGIIRTGDDGLPVVKSVGGKAVAGYGLAGSAASLGSAAASSVVAAGTASATASPLKISDIKLVGDNVHIYVSGTLPTLAYQLTAGDEPAPDGGLKQVQMQYGNTDGDNGEMLIVTPKKPGAQFFQVNRK